MSGTIRLRVTQGHINGGSRVDPRYCPIALALASRFGGLFYVGSRIARDLPAGLRWFCLSPRARQFVADFDLKEPVEPGTFVLTDWRR